LQKIPVRGHASCSASEERDFSCDLLAQRLGDRWLRDPAVLEQTATNAFLEAMTLVSSSCSRLESPVLAFLSERLSRNLARGWEPAIVCWRTRARSPSKFWPSLPRSMRGARRKAQTSEARGAPAPVVLGRVPDFR